MLDRLTRWLLRPLSPPLRLLLLKDLRLFRRDPLQWSQFLLFFGLLSLYFFYVRRFNYGSALVGWMTAIGFMNLAVVGLILSTFTTRFVFPMISLEGQRFWILGTLPVDRRSILWSKFLFAALVCCGPCCAADLLSDLALQLWSRTPSWCRFTRYCVLGWAWVFPALSVGLGHGSRTSGNRRRPDRRRFRRHPDVDPQRHVCFPAGLAAGDSRLPAGGGAELTPHLVQDAVWV